MENKSEINPKKLADALKDWLDDGQLGRADEDMTEPHKTLYALATLTSSAGSDKWPSFSRKEVAIKMRGRKDENAPSKDTIRGGTTYRKLPDYLKGTNRGLMENFPKFKELGYIPEVIIFSEFHESRYRLNPVKLGLSELEIKRDENESDLETITDRHSAVDSVCNICTVEKSEDYCSRTKGETIEYKPERPQLNLLGRMIFAHGYFSTGSWRGYFIKSSAIISACFVFILLLCSCWLLVEFSQKKFVSSAVLALSLLSISGVIWYLFVRPLLLLIDNRIKKMDDIWLPFDSDSCELELVVSKNIKYFKVIRYKSCCSICGSDVKLDNGGREFFSRLVGRCSKSPREHVFSFDKATLLGYPLRQNKTGYRL